MRSTRAEIKERNRRALLDAALELVSRDGYRARLDEIADRAGLTTGAVYSLFGSKDELVAALVADHLRPEYAGLERAIPAGADLRDAVDAVARFLRRRCDLPGARSELGLQLTLLDMALRTPGMRTRLTETVAAQENQLVALFTGREHDGGVVGDRQARRLTTALRALLVGITQGVVLGLAPEADEQYVADAARGLVSGALLDDHAADPDGT